MQGYVLYRDQDDSIDRAVGDAATRKHLIRTLEDLVPDGAIIVGMVIGRDDERFLHLVA